MFCSLLVDDGQRRGGVGATASEIQIRGPGGEPFVFFHRRGGHEKLRGCGGNGAVAVVESVCADYLYSALANRKRRKLGGSSGGDRQRARRADRVARGGFEIDGFECVGRFGIEIRETERRNDRITRPMNFLVMSALLLRAGRLLEAAVVFEANANVQAASELANVGVVAFVVLHGTALS